MANLIVIASALTAGWLVFRLCSFYIFLRSLKGVPVRTFLIGPASFVGNLLDKTIPFIIRGRNSGFVEKFQAYESAGWNLFASVSPYPGNQAIFWVADKDIIKDIAAQRTRFPKPVKDYYLMRLYGESVLVTEGEEWKRHKRISQPAFSEQNNRLVWSSVDGIMSELFEDVWGSKDEVSVKDTLDLSTRFAVMVLGIAAFGKEMRWATNAEVPPGHLMDFPQSIYLVSSNIIATYAMPRWAMGITQKMRKVRTAAAELVGYTSDMIEDKEKGSGSEKTTGISGKSDLFTNLVAASEDEGHEVGGKRLSKSELRGNIFIFLIAGHETTAHTLAFCLGLLALYPEEQQKLFDHIHEVVGDNHAKYEDFPRLTRVQAVINESLRLFSPVSSIPKFTTEDSVFTVSAADPKSDATTQMVIPAGRHIILHTPGLHYNPRYWPDPYEFKPDRFLADWDRDAFIPFSIGARACAGKKFAEVELTAALTFLIPRYTIHLTAEKEAELAGMTIKEKIHKLLETEMRLTLTPPTDLELVFKKRKVAASVS